MLFSLCAMAGCSKDESTPADDTNTPENNTGETNPPSNSTPETSSPEDGSTTEVYDIGGYVSVNIVTAADGTVTYDGLTKAELEASAPNQNVPQKLAAGMEVLIGYAHMQLTDQNNVRRNEGVQQQLEELGFTYSYEAFDFDAGRQLQLIESYLTMGAALIITNMLDVAAAIDFCRRTEEQGCYFVVMGAKPEGYVSSAIYVDQEVFGTLHAELFLSWVDQQYPDAGPGEVKVCYLGNIRNADPALRTQAVEARLAQDERINIVFSNHDTLSLEGAYALMENAFQADPDIRGVITFNVNQAMAANNYICAQPGINYEEYGIFCNNTDDAVTALIEASAANDGTSVLRGTIINDAKVAGSDEVAAVAGLLLQEEETPYDLVQPLWTINSVGYEL